MVPTLYSGGLLVRTKSVLVALSKEKVVISLVTIATVSSLVEEDFAFDKDWQYDISQETIDMMLYGKPQSKVDDRKEMISFLRTANLTYMCKLIHNFFVQRGYAQARVQSLC